MATMVTNLMKIQKFANYEKIGPEYHQDVTGGPLRIEPGTEA